MSKFILLGDLGFFFVVAHYLINCFILVKANVRARRVVVTGPRGTLTRTFRHLSVDIRKIADDVILVEKWFGIKKELAAVRTVCSHIENMIKGVTKV